LFIVDPPLPKRDTLDKGRIPSPPPP